MEQLRLLQRVLDAFPGGQMSRNGVGVHTADANHTGAGKKSASRLDNLQRQIKDLLETEEAASHSGTAGGR
jgi:hypothetical protein